MAGEASLVSDGVVCLSADLLNAAELGVVDLVGCTIVRWASPLAVKWLGIPNSATFPVQAAALHRTLLDCLTEVARQEGSVATVPFTSPTGEALLATGCCLGGDQGETLVRCLLRRAPRVTQTPATAIASRDVELLEAMVEASEDGLWVVSPDGTILDLNSRSTELTGVSKEMIGRTVQEGEGTRYLGRSVTLEVIGARANVTMIQTMRDGRKLLVTGKPIFGSDGRLKYVVLTDREVTELNKVMTRLEETERLSERYRSELRLAELRELEGRDIVARSAQMRAAFELAMRCAIVDSPVLLLGETGTGKGVFARLIHRASGRSRGPFFEINCGVIPEGLMETELFGYAKGAFTGADAKGKLGLIELAHKGTLLLDEIGDLPAVLQVKLLRFLEDGEFLPVGAVTLKRPDVRIIAATNRNLVDMARRGTFRQDLFYRLDVLKIHLPPLRERPEDIPFLIDMFLSKLDRKLRKHHKITPAAVKVISQYAFPGNIRELWNLIERIVVTTDSETIDVRSIPSEILQAGLIQANEAFKVQRAMRGALERTEIETIKEALERCRTQAATAQYLGVGQATISRKLRKYGLRR